MLFFQYPVQQCRLARAEETCEDGDGCLGGLSLLLQFHKNIFNFLLEGDELLIVLVDPEACLCCLQGLEVSTLAD